MKESLEQLFPDVIYRSNSMYFRVETVPKFIDWCDESNIMIVGIEGFEFEDNVIKPRFDLIADFSSATENIEHWDLSRKLLNQAARNFFETNHVKDLVFNFVLKEVGI